MSRRKRSKKSPARWIIIAGVLLLSAAIFLATRNNPAVSPTPQAVQNGVKIPPPGDRVTLVEARAAFDRNQAVFVDVRGPAAYEAGRIPGSVLIPLNEFETRWRELDPNDWIITYCT